jgi:predicted metal-dependent hydrolase
MFGLPLRARAPAAPRLTSGERIEVAGFPVRLKVDGRARRVSLRLDSVAREVVATAPTARRLADALAFAHARAGWIAAQLSRTPGPAPFVSGATVPVDGAPCVLERAAMRGVGRLIPARDGEPARLVASGEGEAFARAVERTLRRAALDRMTALTQVMCARLALPVPPVAVGDARGRWGSCRAPRRGDPGSIRYSWRLLCAPPFVQRYVAAHECAHLVHPNHGPEFWALNRTLDPDMDAARAWLHRHGTGLHALGRS